MLEDFVKQFTDHHIEYVKIKDNYFLLDRHLNSFRLSQEATLMGLYLGKENGRLFIPSCNLLDIIARYSDEKIFVNEVGEIDFLYGKDLRKRHVTMIQGSQMKEKVKLVQNSYDETIGYGIFLGFQKDSSKILTHRVDRGIFIKRDKQLKK
ncbi:MAG: hypothetical protein V1769_04645 [Thermoplasmatota archaeon]